MGSRESAGPPVLLINPRSFRASRWRLAQRAARLARAAGLEVVAAGDPERFRAAFDRLHAERREQVWLLSGDGTIHWIAEYLAHVGDAWSPALLLLGGGRANVVPRETGGYPPMRALRAALAAWRQGTTLREERLPTLRLSQPGDPVRHGFFLAGGMVHEGVRLCSEHRGRGTGWLHRSLVADFYALLELMVQVAVGRSPLPPYAHMRVRLSDGRTLESAPIRVLLAGTLAMRDALYNPFAAIGEGPVRVTAIAATTPHFWRRLPGILRGRFHSSLTPETGTLSGRCAHAEVLGISAYSLDGESFRANPGLPLTIDTGIALRVLRP
ncbi:MAG: hypothetical protein M3Y79_02830 [Pseudomonadota bacterium]|nr:hypothetical protein [Pseudomonadota bacterium]